MKFTRNKNGFIEATSFSEEKNRVDEWLSLESTETLLYLLGKDNLEVDSSGSLWMSRPMAIAFACWSSPLAFVSLIMDEKDKDHQEQDRNSSDDEEEEKEPTDYEESTDIEEEETSSDEEGRFIDELVSVLTRAIEYRRRGDRI